MNVFELFDDPSAYFTISRFHESLTVWMFISRESHSSEQNVREVVPRNQQIILNWTVALN